MSSATDLPTEITGCIFGTTAGLSGISSPSNVTADGSTDVVTFTNFSSSGSLAEDAADAATHEVDVSNKIFWFNGIFYSHNNDDPNQLEIGGLLMMGLVLIQVISQHRLISLLFRSGDTYTATGAWQCWRN